ncbi:S-layer homology domain-containing protein [Herbivorax sp. ANBcel31]|uniref:YcdB/YcdC domain-containing protein n=1 Tax=Herbivorax sp. ANBcel31 TaxID=3069754 RepID=UPI0027AEC89E|nr:YcdB/YcdC domain-containing protein [Herbivorax sp. ANBcel31]MDQ2086539.1 S-layer homology domain-containing protein [Herbivorax sp. ANBcel31]
MKGKISLVLAIIMVVTVCISGGVYADDGMSLEEVIKTARSLLEISDDYDEFNYGVNTFDGKKIWNLSWTKNDMRVSEEVSIDDSGDIFHYYSYDSSSMEDSKKIPDINRGEAQIIAEEFIKKLNSSDFFDSLKLVERNQRMTGNVSHSFCYIATHNEIAVPFNNINISINYHTGQVQNYSKSWTEDFEFPKSDNAITKEEAQEAYKENLGLKLTYNLAGEEVYLAYVPVYGDQYVIDAISGEEINLMPSVEVYFESSLTGRGVADMSAGNMESKEVALSPEEIKSIEESSTLISQEQAEEIVREFEIFEIDDSFKLERATLNRGWDLARNYTWNVSFVKEQSEESREYHNIIVSVNALTGEILNFDIRYPRVEDQSKKYDEEEAKEIVEEFLEKIQPEKFKNTEYHKSHQSMIDPIEGGEDGYYNFRYIRMVDGIPFIDNSFIVRFDGVEGKIYGFNMNWQELDFPSAENVLSLDEIYDLFFEEVGLSLEYRGAEQQYINYERPLYGENPEELDDLVKLVYAVNPERPSRLDAFSGKLLNANGELYEEDMPIEYTDISEHYAKEQIESLAQAGIGLEGPMFRPDEKIKQKDFLLLISQIIDRGYEFKGKTTLENDSETDRLYNLLIREGIVKDGESNPESSLTREESVKFIIRALKYDKIADLRDIFKCDFIDKEEINPELTGYVVLAKGLNIINGYGDYFRPKGELKRGDAVIIIYNCLRI